MYTIEYSLFLLIKCNNKILLVFSFSFISSLPYNLNGSQIKTPLFVTHKFTIDWLVFTLLSNSVTGHSHIQIQKAWFPNSLKCLFNKLLGWKTCENFITIVGVIDGDIYSKKQLATTSVKSGVPGLKLINYTAVCFDYSVFHVQ